MFGSAGLKHNSVSMLNDKNFLSEVGMGNCFTFACMSCHMPT